LAQGCCNHIPQRNIEGSTCLKMVGLRICLLVLGAAQVFASEGKGFLKAHVPEKDVAEKLGDADSVTLVASDDDGTDDKSETDDVDTLYLPEGSGTNEASAEKEEDDKVQTDKVVQTTEDMKAMIQADPSSDQSLYGAEQESDQALYAAQSAETAASTEGDSNYAQSDNALFGSESGSDLALYGGNSASPSFIQTSQEPGSDKALYGRHQESDQALYAEQSADTAPSTEGDANYAQSDKALFGSESGSDLALYGGNSAESGSDLALYGGNSVSALLQVPSVGAMLQVPGSDNDLYGNNQESDSKVALWRESLEEDEDKDSDESTEDNSKEDSEADDTKEDSDDDDEADDGSEFEDIHAPRDSFLQIDDADESDEADDSEDDIYSEEEVAGEMLK